MSNCIKEDHVVEILARLPVASLLRFKSVCKRWYDLITSPSFIAKHFNQSVTNTKRNGSKLLVMVYDSNDQLPESIQNYEERYMLLNDDDKFGDKYLAMNFPFKLKCGYHRVVGSCNGLLCLANDLFSVRPPPPIIIWNPSTRKSATLSRASKPRHPHMFAYGFGVDPITLEYKVVRIKYEMGVMGHPYILPPKVEIYSQGTRLWRDVSSAVPPYHIVDVVFWSQAFVDGAVHWLAYDACEEGTSRNLIMLFNMASESFSEFKLPPTLAYQSETSFD